MPDQFTPRPSDMSTFGLWTVGYAGRDAAVQFLKDVVIREPATRA